LQELHAALRRVQGELSRYSHVNRKALDQFVNFTEQREALTRRVTEVTQSGACACVLAGVHVCACVLAGEHAHVVLHTVAAVLLTASFLVAAAPLTFVNTVACAVWGVTYSAGQDRQRGRRQGEGAGGS
jgi:uncharacterized protein (DUF2062 family)